MSQQPPNTVQRILLVDGDPVAISAMRKAAMALTWASVVAVARTADRALQAARTSHPDIALIDADLPGNTSLELVRAVTLELPDTRVVVTALAEDDELAVEAVRAGACGYVVKPLDVRRMARVLATVADGGAFISRRVTMRLFQLVHNAPDSAIVIRPIRSLTSH